MDLNLESVRVGQTISCNVNKDGELHYFVDGKDRGIGWTGLPTDVPLWGFADIYGLARKIKLLFIFGKFLCGLVLADFADEEPKMEQLAIRLKNAESKRYCLFKIST